MKKQKKDVQKKEISEIKKDVSQYDRTSKNYKNVIVNDPDVNQPHILPPGDVETGNVRVPNQGVE